MHAAIFIYKIILIGAEPEHQMTAMLAKMDDQI